MKYSKKFERDFEWYSKNSNIFNFDGSFEYYNKVGESLIHFEENGVPAKKAFYLYDSQGKIVKTKEPELLRELYKCKGSINLNIKMWAEDRAKGILPKILFDEMVKELELLDWMVEAVEKQKVKYYEIIFR